MAINARGSKNRDSAMDLAFSDLNVITCLPYSGTWKCGTNAQVAERSGNPHRNKQEAKAPVMMAGSKLARVGTVIDWISGLLRRVMVGGDRQPCGLVIYQGESAVGARFDHS